MKIAGGLGIKDWRGSCEIESDRRRRLSGGGLILEAITPVPATEEP